VIPPGGTGKVVAEVDTKNRFGAQRKSVRVESNDPDERVVRLSVSFVSESPIDVYPNRFVNLRGVDGKRVDQTLVLHRVDGEPLEILETSATRPGVVVEATPVTDENADPPEARHAARPGDVRLTVAVEPARGRRVDRGVVRVKTNHPEAPQIDLPLRIMISELLEVLPQRVTIHHRSPRERSATRVTVRHGARRKFRIEDVRVEGNLPGVSARILSRRAMGTQIVETSVEGYDLANGRYAGELVIETSVKRRPELRVPVVLIVRGGPKATPPRGASAGGSGPKQPSSR
jgi:hypothetical protein